MIVAKTPLRIPLAGGLSDLAPYARRFGGETVSVTIDKHVYVAVKDDLDGAWDVRYRDTHERTGHADDLRHDLLRESVRLLGLQDRPIDVDFRVDLAGESGLGTSGALTVSILHALHRLVDRPVEPWELLHEAARVEVELLAGASGFHDPAICTLGGLRHLGYDGQTVRDLDMRAGAGIRAAFDDALLLFYSGRHAKSKPSLDILTSHLDEAVPVLHDIRALAAELADAFAVADLPGVARCVAEQQRLKQRLPGRFVDDQVEEVVARVAATGAAAQLPGGKISAFVLVVCPDGQQDAVRRALHDLREVPVRTVDVGARVVAI